MAVKNLRHSLAYSQEYQKYYKVTGIYEKNLQGNLVKLKILKRGPLSYEQKISYSYQLSTATDTEVKLKD